jgi:PhnB protein
MLSDGTTDAPAFPVWLHVYVRDVDETYQRALDYGAGSVQTPSEQGDGDRRGGIRDPAGNMVDRNAPRPLRQVRSAC